MSEKEISDIRETLRYYETTQTEPTYCDELITTGELKRLLEKKDKEIERLTENNEAMQEEMCRTWEKNKRLNNIINELEKYLIKYSQDLEFRCYVNTFLEKLQNQLQQKENIIKEVREYIEQLLEYKKDKKVSLEHIERIIDIINQDKRY